MRVKSWESYFPSLGEFATTIGVLAALILVYRLALKHLPIHREEPLDEQPLPAAMPHTAEAIA